MSTPEEHLDQATRRRFAELVFQAVDDDDTILVSTINEIARTGFQPDDIRAVCAEPSPSTWAAAERLSRELDQVEANYQRHSARFLDDIGEVLAHTDPDDPTALDAAATRIAKARLDDLEGRR